MHALRRHVRFLVLWTLAVTALMLSNPLGGFGWLEFAAALLPLLLFVDRRIQREPALAIGVPALTLVWLVAPGEAPILRLLTAWAIVNGTARFFALSGRWGAYWIYASGVILP